MRYFLVEVVPSEDVDVLETKLEGYLQAQEHLAAARNNPDINADQIKELVVIEVDLLGLIAGTRQKIGQLKQPKAQQPDIMSTFMTEIAQSLETIMLRLQQSPSPTHSGGGNTNININGSPWGSGGGTGGGSTGIPPDLIALLEKLRGSVNAGGGGESILVGLLNKGDFDALERLKDDLRNMSLDLAPLAENKEAVLRHAAQVVRIGAQLQAWITRVTKRS